MQITLSRWKDLTKERKSKRIVLKKAVICKSIHILYSAFQILVKYSIWSISAQYIQGLVRRAIGRMELRFRLILFTSAILIQSTFRSYAQRRNISYIFLHRIKMAIKIQCVVRQLRSKLFTFNRLLTCIEVERRLQAKQRKAWVEGQKIIAAIFTQKGYRRMQGKRILKTVESMRHKELEACREIDEIKRAYIIERAVQQRELEQYYEKKRILWQRHDDEKKRCAKLKVEMERIHRKILNVAETQREEDDVLRLRGKLLKEIKDKVHHMELEVITKSQKYREYCLRCIDSPKDRKEIQQGINLKKLIRNRYGLCCAIDFKKCLMYKILISLILAILT